MSIKEGMSLDKFQIRVYSENEGMIIEVSRVTSPETLQSIINFLEKLRE